ncbi:hypothetical protein [Anaeromicrobium sediminis]|uniref:Copper amine oxidase-like N-terminal domain-containing protein n=1 Tax=Anaeromicrobium sediminis TaxID=1478221 RepID=A0A267MGS8_9FIRM|nr:hypothetical protein [Anaeromicrobium sediminis]PAB58756.1 hypothetical protein CCE28_13885 [Anaeromicrobium sediminis]
MKKNVLLIIMSTCILFLLSPISKANSVMPGSEDDPLVTQTYVEMRNSQLKYYVDEKLSQISQNDSGGQTTYPVFEVIETYSGQRIIAGASTELIVRSGSATAIGSASGGVLDLISGVDLQTGQNVPLNHLLLFPRDDGRGIVVGQDKTYILIKGPYEIK